LTAAAHDPLSDESAKAARKLKLTARSCRSEPLTARLLRCMLTMAAMLVRILLALLLLKAVMGCGSRPAPSARRTVIFVPGVVGDGPWYKGLKRGLGSEQEGLHIASRSWGAALPLFVLNFNSPAIHRSAERDLANRIRRLQIQRPEAAIDIIAHSAGCGVALGALALLDAPTAVNNVILLAPSVSPSYDLAPALGRMQGKLHGFHSDRDTLFLSWRTSSFGTYDNVKTRAAGNAGFDLRSLPPDLLHRVVQHAYDPGWKTLGNDGSHDGAVARDFAAQVLRPLLQLSPLPPARSFSANPH
jgi:hypothetical protein